jgi:hypothetical protein
MPQKLLPFDKLLPKKIDHNLIILSVLILLDAFTFVVFDVIAGSRGGYNFQAFNTLSSAGWILDPGHIVSLLTGQYDLNFISTSIGSYYGANSFIINKVAVILVSGIVVAAIYRYVPALLPVCYGYLIGIAGVGVFDGLQNIGVISSSELFGLHFDSEVLPQVIMTICIVAGGIISFSKVAAYLLSQLVSLHIFGKDSNSNYRIQFMGFRIPSINYLFKNSLYEKASIPIKSEDHKAWIPMELLPQYEKNIRELADLDTQNSVEAIQQSYDLVNQMSERYGVDQYHIMYDVYKEKNGGMAPEDHYSVARENTIDKEIQ